MSREDIFQARQVRLRVRVGVCNVCVCACVCAWTCACACTIIILRVVCFVLLVFDSQAAIMSARTMTSATTMSAKKNKAKLV